MVVRLKTDCADLLLNQELIPGNYYRVVTISYDSYRLVADDGRASLYKSIMFDVISDSIPDDWILEIDNKGQKIYHGPAVFSSPGFFEDCWDGDVGANRVLQIRLSKWGLGEDYVINCGMRDESHN